MNWTEESILRFIGVYKERPVLWDANDPNYKLTAKKIDAWSELSKMLNVAVPELKRKMNSLLASYRRERQKAKLEAVRLGTEDAYESSWFAYKSLDFLRDKYQPRPSKHEQEVVWSRAFDEDITIKEENAETFEYDEYNTGIIHADQDVAVAMDHREDNLDAFRFLPWARLAPYKRKRAQEEPPPRRARDQFDAYGEYLAAKLRSMDTRTCAHVQRAFADVLFQADMGRCAEGTRSPQPSASPHNQDDAS